MQRNQWIQKTQRFEKMQNKATNEENVKDASKAKTEKKAPSRNNAQNAKLARSAWIAKKKKCCQGPILPRLSRLPGMEKVQIKQKMWQAKEYKGWKQCR